MELKNNNHVFMLGLGLVLDLRGSVQVCGSLLSSGMSVSLLM